MPPGAPFNSFILPFSRIRVDDFADSATLKQKAALHLLTHTHTDHLTGLNAKSFGSVVVCSADAKQMLLQHEVGQERALLDSEMRAEKTKTYAHLQRRPRHLHDGSVDKNGSRDLLRVIPKHVPTEFILSEGETVVITAFDANHCPGAVMYLVENDDHAILHTGDLRAEPWFLAALAKNHFLQPYLASEGTKVLDAIYLDTASVLSTVEIPNKSDAVKGLIDLMKQFPDDAHFFLNTWTWGYEDILIGVAEAFETKIHVDRYKRSIFSHLEDQSLNNIITNAPESTRFHACERFHRCEYVDVEVEEGDDILADPEDQSISHDGQAYNTTSKMGKRVVYVNPVSMGLESWKLYMKEMNRKFQRGEKIHHLMVPLHRHSTLPELQSFVSFFKPRTVVPNTLTRELHGIDHVCIERMFENCVREMDVLRLPDIDIALESLTGQDYDQGEDVALKNLVGLGAKDVAMRWADSGLLRRKFQVIKQFLSVNQRAIIDRVLGRLQDDETQIEEASQTPYLRYRYNDTSSDHDSDDGQTAHILLGRSSQNQSFSSPTSQVAAASDPVNVSNDVTRPTRQAKKRPWEDGLLTPESSPVPVRSKDKQKERQRTPSTPREAESRTPLAASDSSGPRLPSLDVFLNKQAEKYLKHKNEDVVASGSRPVERESSVKPNKTKSSSLTPKGSVLDPIIISSPSQTRNTKQRPVVRSTRSSRKKRVDINRVAQNLADALGLRDSSTPTGSALHTTPRPAKKRKVKTQFPSLVTEETTPLSDRRKLLALSCTESQYL